MKLRNNIAKLRIEIVEQIRWHIMHNLVVDAIIRKTTLASLLLLNINELNFNKK